MEDPELVARLRDEQIALTVCPLSNVALRVVAALGDHMLPGMLDAGLLATVNSDDPAYFGGYVDDNLAAVRRRVRLRRRAARRAGAELVRRLLRARGGQAEVEGRGRQLARRPHAHRAAAR